MDILRAIDAAAPASMGANLSYGIIEVLVYGALAIAVACTIATCWYCFFECRRWRHFHGRSIFWPLIF